jgi:nucleoside 2-deoxyribosyltransferase
VTEVGLFTDKIEVKKTDLTEDEIDKKLKEKLAKFMNVSDAEVIDVEPVEEKDIDTGNPAPASADTENPDAS